VEAAAMNDLIANHTGSLDIPRPVIQDAALRIGCGTGAISSLRNWVIG
jgi:hypothetical protein